MNITVLLNETASQIGLEQTLPVIIDSPVVEIKEVDISSVATEGSDKPCSDAISSQTPTSVQLPGSLDALLYIVIVLLFYAFSIVILMVKYIRREREEASLRSYYHEFVSREKFRSAQYKNRQFMKRIFKSSSNNNNNNNNNDFDPSAVVSLEDEFSSTTRYPQLSRSKKKGNSPEEATFSRLLLDFEDGRKRERSKESFTFLGAKSQFCKNSFLGKRFCNKQLCSKCVSESVPTIDWDDDDSCRLNNSPSGTMCEENVKKVIEVTLHRSALERSPRPVKTQPSLTESLSNFNSRFTEADNLFYPIVECESEKETVECNSKGYQQQQVTHKSVGPYNSNASPFTPSVGSSDAYRKPTQTQPKNTYTCFEEHAMVSSCSLEVSELLANMPPMGISHSPSNDMDTLDGLSNLDSETENQSLLNYSSSVRLHRDPSFNRDTISINSKRNLTYNKGDNGQILNFVTTATTDKSDKLSDRSSLLSCTFSFDDVDLSKSARSSFYGARECNSDSSSIHPDLNNIIETDLQKTYPCKSNGKFHQNNYFHNHKIIAAPSPPAEKTSEKDGSDDEMVRLLNDITVLADQSGVFRNLKYFLRGFYKSDAEEPSENSNLLPKETYFGPGSPKSLRRGDCAHKPGTNGFKTISPSLLQRVPTLDAQCSRSNFNRIESECVSDQYIHDKNYNEDDDDVVTHNLGNRWAYTYDNEDDLEGFISDTDQSSSFGNYCMGETSESQVIDLSKPLARRELDANVKAGFSRALIGLEDTYSNNNYIEPVKANPLIAGYGSARKETKV